MSQIAEDEDCGGAIMTFPGKAVGPPAEGIDFQSSVFLRIAQ